MSVDVAPPVQAPGYTWYLEWEAGYAKSVAEALPYVQLGQADWAQPQPLEQAALTEVAAVVSETVLEAPTAEASEMMPAPAPVPEVPAEEMIANTATLQREKAGKWLGRLARGVWDLRPGRQNRRHRAEMENFWGPEESKGWPQLQGMLNQDYEAQRRARDKRHVRIAAAAVFTGVLLVGGMGATFVASANGSSKGVRQLGELGKLNIMSTAQLAGAQHTDQQISKAGAWREPNK